MGPPSLCQQGCRLKPRAEACLDVLSLQVTLRTAPALFRALYTAPQLLQPRSELGGTMTHPSIHEPFSRGPGPPRAALWAAHR